MSDVLALGYHGISASWPAETTVAPERFEAQLMHLVAQGYRGATFSGALTAPPAPRTVAVTFDDAHRSVLELALPIMSRLGLVGTVFVPTAYADGGLMGWPGIAQWMGGPHEPELRCMTWDELRSLAELGWEIGSHTRSHPRLTQLDAGALAAELRESREQCEDALVRPCRSLAYPYSDFDDRVARAALDTGYRFAATIPRGVAAPLPLRWPRVGVYGHTSDRRFRVRVSRRLRVARGSSAWRTLNGARHRVLGLRRR